MWKIIVGFFPWWILMLILALFTICFIYAIIKFIKYLPIRPKIVAAFQEWDEWWHVPLSITFLLYSPRIYRLWDDTAGEVDIGLVQKAILAWVLVVIINALAMLLTRVNDKELYHILNGKYLDENKKPLYDVTRWQIIKLSTFRYSLYFISIVILTALMK